MSAVKRYYLKDDNGCNLDCCGSYLARSGKGDWVDYDDYATLQAKYDALVDKLAKTADGAVVALDQIVWFADDGDHIHEMVVCGWSQWDSLNLEWSTGFTAEYKDSPSFQADLDCVYSTREAAEQAQSDGGG